MTQILGDDPPDVPPAGFERFWSTTLAELDAVEPGIVEHPSTPGSDLDTLAYQSFGGARIGAYLARSRTGGPRPLIVHGHGYTSSGAEISRHWLRAGADVFGIDLRGYGRSAGAVAGLAAEGYILTGAESPEHSVLRGAVCDYLRGVEVALTLRGSRVSRLILQGTSFTGGLATIAQALRPRADLLVLRVPSLAWTEARMRLARASSGLELRQYIEAHPERAVATLRTLGHFDALHHAGRVTCPTLVGVGERDDVVPACTVMALYERLAGPRELMRFPVSHTGSPQEQEWQRFDDRWIEIAADGLPSDFGRGN